MRAGLTEDHEKREEITITKEKATALVPYARQSDHTDHSKEDTMYGEQTFWGENVYSREPELVTEILGPGERIVDGRIMYSAAWLNDDAEIAARERETVRVLRAYLDAERPERRLNADLFERVTKAKTFLRERRPRD